MLISTNTASTRPTKRTKNVNRAKYKALVYTKEIVIRIYTIEDIYTEENTKKAKKIKDSDQKSAIFITN
jgi:hypothetical protein